MKFSINKSIEILERTPAVLNTMLLGLSEDWVMNNEGGDSFSPFDVAGHLLNGEKTDWTLRTRRIMEYGTSLPFEPYDRFAQARESAGKSIDDILSEFSSIRKKNIEWLISLGLTEEDLDKKGMHPGLGEVTLRQLLASWVIHDLTHIAQIGRVMAKQYKEEMGPWLEYFRIMQF